METAHSSVVPALLILRANAAITSRVFACAATEGGNSIIPIRSDIRFLVSGNREQRSRSLKSRRIFNLRRKIVEPPINAATVYRACIDFELTAEKENVWSTFFFFSFASTSFRRASKNIL